MRERFAADAAQAGAEIAGRALADLERLFDFIEAEDPQRTRSS